MFTKQKILVVALIITNLAFLILLIQQVKERRKYENEMVVMSQYAAALEALHDFEVSKLRIYELKENAEREFANRHEGVFEIWYMPYYPIVGVAAKRSIEEFVQMYNSKMRNMYEKRGKCE